MIKSMLQGVNLNVGIANVCSRPVGKDMESLVFLQKSHAKINLLMEACTFYHQTLVDTEQVSFLVPRWAPVTEVCNFSMRS